MFAPVRTRSVFGALAQQRHLRRGGVGGATRGAAGRPGAGNSNCLRYVKGPMPDTPAQRERGGGHDRDGRPAFGARCCRCLLCCLFCGGGAQLGAFLVERRDGERWRGGETVVCVTCVIIGTLANVVVVGGAGDDGRETPDDDPKTSSEGMHSPRCRMSFSIRRLRMRASSTSSRSSNNGEHGSFSDWRLRGSGRLAGGRGRGGA